MLRDILFLAGGGMMGARMRAHDWSVSPLGSPAEWPQSFRSVVGLLLNSKFPMFVAWGDQLGFLYNDAYADILGAKHPAALGRPFLEIWSEIWDDISPLIDAALAGQATYRENLPLAMNRHGFEEHTWFTFSYSPVRDESGAVAGMFCACMETTAQVLGERRRTALLDLDDRLRRAADTADLSFAASELLGSVLGACRVGYGAIDAAAGTILVERNWSAPGFTDVAGLHDFADYGSYIHDLRTGRVVANTDVEADPRTSAWASAFRTLSIRAHLDVPIMEAGKTIGGLFIHSATPRIWSDEEIAFVKQFAERTRAAIARRVAEDALRGNDDRQAFLLDLSDALRSLAEPGDVIATASRMLGERLQASRVFYAEIAGTRMTVERDFTQGVASIAGEHSLASFGPEVLESYRGGAVVAVSDVETDPRFGDQARTEFRGRHVAAFLDIILFDDKQRVGLLAVQNATSRIWTAAEERLVREVGERVKTALERARADAALRTNEARLALLHRLGEETAPLADADAVLAATTRLLGEHLNLSICAYADMDEDEDGFTIRGDWAAPGSKSIVGHYQLAAFGKLAVENLHAGLPLVVHDNLVELAPEEAATFQNIGIAATICMPLVKDGRLTALMAIHDRRPRRWTDTDLALLREVTARSWAHVERVAAAADLRASEARFRLMADAVPQIVWITDAEGRTEFFNKQWTDYTGIAFEPSTAEDVSRMAVHPDDGPPTIAAFDEARRTGTTFLVEHRIRSAIGEYRWFLVRGEPYRDPVTGEVVRWFGASVDIHDRKAAAEQLRELNETLEAQVSARTAERNRVWEMSRDLFAIMGFDGYLKVINPAWMTTLGFDRETLLSRPFGEQVHPDDHQAIGALLEQLRRGETVVGFEDRLRHADGSWRWIAWGLVPEGDVFYAVGRDVTAEKEREAELTIAQEALRQAQKMDAMGQLTGGVAHDFNNLLTPIVGALDLLQRKGLGDEREQRLIAGASQSADRAKILVQRLLAFARRQPLQPVAVDIAALVTGMGDLIASTTGPQINVVVEVEDDLPPARADANQLEMALLNLGVNARDAMPEGGTLRITAKAAEAAAGNPAGVVPGSYVRLSVADTGTGMDEAVLKRAVEPFFSTKGIGKGTGLGLSMVHGLTSQLGGALTIQSRAGIGTNVELWLPASATSAPETVRPSQSHAETSSAGQALLVDDEELVRASTAAMLAEMGYKVAEAPSAEAALRLLNGGLAPDLLVTDHLMPGMTGTELARAVLARSPETKIVIVSGYADAEGIAIDLPRLTKPFRHADLAEMLG